MFGDRDYLQKALLVDSLSSEGPSILFFPSLKSFYGSPPNISFNNTAGFKTSGQPYLLKYGAPCPPDVIVR